MVPYKTSFLQQLLAEDNLLRLNYAQIICRELSDCSGCLGRTFVPDECIFHTNGLVNEDKASVWPRQPACCRRGTDTVRKAWINGGKSIIQKLLVQVSFPNQFQIVENTKDRLPTMLCWKYSIRLGVQFFSKVRPHAVGYWWATLFGNKTFTTWDMEGRSDSVVGNMTSLDWIRFVSVGYIENLAVSVQIVSSSHMKKRLNKRLQLKVL